MAHRSSCRKMSYDRAVLIKLRLETAKELLTGKPGEGSRVRQVLQ